ncbi:putative transmembrane domain-containing protein [Neospora caninum Liverpool]|uniref:Putative transmembrane domain-containing protein n=1 Tax=Neospora caninum (strain Liverpool) TaxID=572307 RepID=F0VI56_NEOCL|nr:putative transmembrane domain-containing protein [Neospora caninum Liverpool]CBZ53417.1 putative transmembrane domain-containing protein [Neospora caninum Liverpool]CEL67404.1 TPA: transmembrane domain-containing protein,putative [Neospora caninum Liverpool]|eukprot:XP_003883449.1 putative transmembrane domain-containing protein [Neospora caninum Liverpool]
MAEQMIRSAATGPSTEDDGDSVESRRPASSLLSGSETPRQGHRREASAAGEPGTRQASTRRQAEPSQAGAFVARTGSTASDGRSETRSEVSIELERKGTSPHEIRGRSVSNPGFYWGASPLSFGGPACPPPDRFVSTGTCASSAREHRRMLSRRAQTPRGCSGFAAASLDVAPPATAFLHTHMPARNLAASGSFSSVSTHGTGGGHRPEGEPRSARTQEAGYPEKAPRSAFFSEKERSTIYFDRRGQVFTSCMTDWEEDDASHRNAHRAKHRRMVSRPPSTHDGVSVARDDRSICVDPMGGGVGGFYDGATLRRRRASPARCCSRWCRATGFVNQWRKESVYGVYPIWTLSATMWVCIIGTILCLALGAWLIVEDNRHVECRLNYEDETLQEGGSRYSLLSITADLCGSRNSDLTELTGPYVYVYVEMENFFQNDAQILWSRNEAQLAGKIITDPSELSDCDPVVTAVVNNVTKILHPCGALAWNVFTDRFQFLDAVPDDAVDSGPVKPLVVEQSQDILLSSLDWRSRFKNPPAEERAKYRDQVYFWMSQVDNDDGQDMYKSREEAKAELLMDRLNYEEAGEMVENGHFIQWMQVATFGTWRKLYGRIKGPVELPLFAYIAVTYDVKQWRGKKAIVLVQPSRFGGRTQFTGITYLVFGCILGVFAIYMLWKRWYKTDALADDAVKDIRWRAGSRKGKKKLK